ncbi:hypothetical protein [Nocardioides terrisoli]|uniref:hypothetical protein n=1 Tax=Nocardioides terrisoli TaxID=3388267 RepID=UPI00287B79DA|nr:hypothetical protein [Nocardioides marmorisolisilvae]
MASDAPADPPPAVTEAEYISYESWGGAFFRAAVTADRVLSGVSALSGQPIALGPMGVGPGRLARITAHGGIGSATISRVDDELLSYRVIVPVTLDFEVDLQVETHRFHAELEVPLVLTARALTGVRIFIDVLPPRASDVQATVRAEGLRASIVQRIANVEGELRRFVAKYVAREVEKPEIVRARTVDVAASIDKTWASIAPTSGSRVSADLSEALEADIRENEDRFLDGAE